MIVNLTQHKSTPEQRAQGVYDLTDSEFETLKRLLTFEKLPTPEEILDRAENIAWLAYTSSPTGDLDDADGPPTHAMIGGAPYLMGALEDALRGHGIEPLYAFSVRESVEHVLPDGSIQKNSIFKHIGFVQPPERDDAPKPQGLDI